METWAKQLEDALPNALPEVRELIMDEYCPYDMFADEFAPEFVSSEPCDGEQCKECWDSCDSKCRYSEVSRMDENDICYECRAYGDDYYIDENGELVRACDECSVNPYRVKDEGEQNG